MLRRICFPVAALLVLAVTPALQGQVCGDANESGTLSLADPTRIIDHIAISGVPVDASVADCDGRAGITVSDVQALFRYLFYMENVLDCSASETYSFSPAPNDTIFLPYMTGIDPSIDSVAIPIKVYWEVNTNSLYLPLSGEEADWGGYFYPTAVVLPTIMSMARNIDGAWVVLVNEYSPYEPIEGYNTSVTLIMRRINPGEATIQCETIALDDLRRPCVGKIDGDLHVPVITTSEVPAPSAHVSVDPASASFVAMAGSWSPTVEEISFESDQGAVSFQLETSDDWLVIEDFQAGGYATPCTVTIRADATMTPIGSYSGSLLITNPDPAEAEFNITTVEVSLTVTDPFAFLWGDVNCDGVISLGDVSRLIDFLFLSETPIEPCQ